MNNKYEQKDLDKLSDEQKERLKENYPIEYLLKEVKFYDCTIKVDERVLIPRFETEFLVDDTYKLINKYILNPKIIDICCGSGCIAISLAKKLNKEVDALDISNDAISLAKENSILNKTKVNFINEDIKKFQANKKYNILISNPPYVKYDEEVGKETKFEPQIALYAKNNGLEFYEDILEKSINFLEKGNIIAFEIGATLAKDIIKMVNKYYPNAKIILKKDLNNFDRYIYILNILQK